MRHFGPGHINCFSVVPKVHVSVSLIWPSGFLRHAVGLQSKLKTKGRVLLFQHNKLLSSFSVAMVSGCCEAEELAVNSTLHAQPE